MSVHHNLKMAGKGFKTTVVEVGEKLRVCTRILKNAGKWHVSSIKWREKVSTDLSLVLEVGRLVCPQVKKDAKPVDLLVAIRSNIQLVASKLQ